MYVQFSFINKYNDTLPHSIKNDYKPRKFSKNCAKTSLGLDEEILCVSND